MVTIPSSPYISPCLLVKSSIFDDESSICPMINPIPLVLNTPIVWCQSYVVKKTPIKPRFSRVFLIWGTGLDGSQLPLNHICSVWNPPKKWLFHGIFDGSSSGYQWISVDLGTPIFRQPWKYEWIFCTINYNHHFQTNPFKGRKKKRFMWEIPSGKLT